MKRKLLVVADLNFASPRVPGLVKYLDRSEWEVFVLSAPLTAEMMDSTGLSTDSVITVGSAVEHKPNLWRAKMQTWRRGPRILRIALRLAKAVRSWILRIQREFAWYPDRQREWRSPAYDEGLRVIRQESIHVIMSSSSPVTCHVVASALSRKTLVPWVADFRDLWSQNHAYYHSSLRRALDRRLEQRVLLPAACALTVSAPLADQLRNLHVGTRVRVVRNGYDPVAYDSQARQQTKEFTITYTGQLYPRQHDPTPLLEALNASFQAGAVERSRTCIRFFGPPSDVLERAVSRYGLEDAFEFHGPIERSLIARKQQESQLLLLFNWGDPVQKGVYSQKIFEYLGARRPILAVGGHRADVGEELIQSTRSGRYCVTASETQDALEAYYADYRTHGRVNYSGLSKEIAKVSFPQLALELSRVLHDVTHGSLRNPAPR